MAGAIITVRKNGSLRVEGDFQILDSDGVPFDLSGRTAVSLCRCGLSKTKPFCDSTHKTSGFVSEEKARKLPPLPVSPAQPSSPAAPPQQPPA